MSISLHTGNPRNGKTYGINRIAWKCLKKGMIVYSNYKINWQGMNVTRFSWKRLNNFQNPFHKVWIPKENLKYWKRLSDLYTIDNGIILMDEAHIYLNSRRWAELPEEFEKKLYQHGKDGLHIIGTVQNIRRLDTIMRELVDYWYIYQAFPQPPRDPWIPHRPLWFKKYQIGMENDLSSHRYLLSTRIILFRKKIAKRYNTLEKIDRVM